MVKNSVKREDAGIVTSLQGWLPQTCSSWISFTDSHLDPKQHKQSHHQNSAVPCCCGHTSHPALPRLSAST